MFDAFGTAMIVIVLYTAAIAATLAARRGKINAARFLYVNSAVLYFLVLFCVTLLPVSGGQTKGANFIPFVSMLAKTDRGYVFHTGVFFHYLTTTLLNVVLFLPFGFLLTVLLKLRGVRYAFLIAGLTGLFTSLSIELLQLVLPANRIFDVDDLIFNTLGTVLGIVTYHALAKTKVFRRALSLIAGRDDVKGD